MKRRGDKGLRGGKNKDEEVKNNERQGEMGLSEWG